MATATLNLQPVRMGAAANPSKDGCCSKPRLHWLLSQNRKTNVSRSEQESKPDRPSNYSKNKVFAKIVYQLNSQNWDCMAMQVATLHFSLAFDNGFARFAQYEALLLRNPECGIVPQIQKTLWKCKICKFITKYTWVHVMRVRHSIAKILMNKVTNETYFSLKPPSLPVCSKLDEFETRVLYHSPANLLKFANAKFLRLPAFKTWMNPPAFQWSSSFKAKFEH